MRPHEALQQGIEVGQVHSRNDKHDCVAQIREELPGGVELEMSLVSIPSGWWVTERERALRMTGTAYGPSV